MKHFENKKIEKIYTSIYENNNSDDELFTGMEEAEKSLNTVLNKFYTFGDHGRCYVEDELKTVAEVLKEGFHPSGADGVFWEGVVPQEYGHLNLYDCTFGVANKYDKVKLQQVLRQYVEYNEEYPDPGILSDEQLANMDFEDIVSTVCVL